jgi:YggT family protein
VLLWAVLWLARSVLYLLLGLVILQAILSWVNPFAPLAPAVQQLTEPLLSPIRRFVPLIGGVDLSPLVLVVLLQALLIFIDPARLGFLLR